MKYLGEKLTNVEYIQRKGAYGLIFNVQNDMAVLYLSKYNMYNLPGGKMEENEDGIESLIREVKEEMGHEIKNIKYFKSLGLYYYFEYTKQYVQGMSAFYAANIGEKVCEPTETDHELLWVKPKEIIDKMYFEHHALAIKEYCKL